MIAPKLNPLQIENMVNKIVPLIAAPADYEFFKGVLYVFAENNNSADVAAFVAKLLNN